MGDKRTYEQVIALRAVSTEDFMTADWYVFIGSRSMSDINLSLLILDMQVLVPTGRTASHLFAHH